MTARSLQEALDAGGLRLSDTYPRDLISAVPFHLPITFVSIGELTTTTLENWLAHRRISFQAEGRDRSLHGALIARAGRGIIFFDSADDEEERRFTAAHEIAHFIEDHLLPRLKALKAFGPDILAVLDGERPATPEEAVSAVLTRVPLGVRVHLMDRGPDGAICSWDVEEREQRADRLALEIVAPARAALRELRQAGYAGGLTEIEGAPQVLSDRFGLPKSAAAAYANLLLGKRRARPKLSEILVGASD